MTVALDPLVRAVARLREGLDRHGGDPDDEQLRDGLIQRFEFTYDLSHRILRRVIEEGAANPEDVDRMSFASLIRTAGEQGLIVGDWPMWRTFREMRNITSHSYDATLAVRVVAGIPTFLIEAEAMLAKLQDHPAE